MTFQAKKVVFLVSRGKIKYHHFWLPLEKSIIAPLPGKNLSDAHVC